MRAIGISTGPTTHLDHLGVLCILFGIPLIITDEEAYETARHFYPQLDVRLHSWHDLSLYDLAEHTDVLFGCGKFWAESLLPSLACICRKEMRFVFCPHGNSDKGRSKEPGERHPKQDIALIYGDHMHNLLKNSGALSMIGHTIPTGNYRYSYYLKHKAFYDGLAEEHIFRHLPQDKKVLLYAPTWPNKENPSPVFELVEQLIQELCPSFTLLIKWHPLLAEFYPAQTYRLLGRYENHAGAKFIANFPPIYPLLDRSDAYIGDFSSIGYDFLLFDRPLYFLPTEGAEGGSLFTCGLSLPEDKLVASAQYIKESWEENQYHFQGARKNLYNHAFGTAQEMNCVKEEILKIIEKPTAF